MITKELVEKLLCSTYVAKAFYHENEFGVFDIIAKFQETQENCEVYHVTFSYSPHKCAVKKELFTAVYKTEPLQKGESMDESKLVKFVMDIIIGLQDGEEGAYENWLTEMAEELQEIDEEYGYSLEQACNCPHCRKEMELGEDIQNVHGMLSTNNTHCYLYIDPQCYKDFCFRLSFVTLPVKNESLNLASIRDLQLQAEEDKRLVELGYYSEDYLNAYLETVVVQEGTFRWNHATKSYECVEENPQTITYEPYEVVVDPLTFGNVKKREPQYYYLTSNDQGQLTFFPTFRSDWSCPLGSIDDLRRQDQFQKRLLEEGVDDEGYFVAEGAYDLILVKEGVFQWSPELGDYEQISKEHELTEAKTTRQAFDVYLADSEGSEMKRVDMWENLYLSDILSSFTEVILQYKLELKKGSFLFVVNEKNECVHFAQFEHWHKKEERVEFPYLMGRLTKKEETLFETAWSNRKEA